MLKSAVGLLPQIVALDAAATSWHGAGVVTRTGRDRVR